MFIYCKNVFVETIENGDLTHITYVDRCEIDEAYNLTELVGRLFKNDEVFRNRFVYSEDLIRIMNEIDMSGMEIVIKREMVETKTYENKKYNLVEEYAIGFMDD